MVEMKVNASELKGDENKLFEKLSDFLKEKTGGDVTNDGKTVSIKGEGSSNHQEIHQSHSQKIHPQTRADRKIQSHRRRGKHA